MEKPHIRTGSVTPSGSLKRSTSPDPYKLQVKCDSCGNVQGFIPRTPGLDGKTFKCHVCGKSCSVQACRLGWVGVGQHCRIQKIGQGKFK